MPHQVAAIVVVVAVLLKPYFRSQLKPEKISKVPRRNMRDHCRSKRNRTIASSSHYWDWMKHNTLLLGIASLIWLVFKSGRKPSRIQYPCQKAAATHVSLFLLPLLLPLIHKTYRYLKTCSRQQTIRFAVAAALSIGMIFSVAHLWARHQQAQQIKYYNQLRSSGPFGKKIAGASAIAVGFLSIPHAMEFCLPTGLFRFIIPEQPAGIFSVPAPGLALRIMAMMPMWTRMLWIKWSTGACRH